MVRHTGCSMSVLPSVSAESQLSAPWASHYPTTDGETCPHTHPYLLNSLHLEPVPGCGSGNLWRWRNLWSLLVQQPLLNCPPSRAFFQGAEELPPEKRVATLERPGE